MAAYCTKADLVARFGEKELAELTDETAATSIDDTEVDNACDEASSLIDSYVAVRYVTPLDPVPTIVRKWACDLARAAIWKDRAGKDSAVTRNADAAMAQIRDVAKGIASLPDATGETPADAGGTISVIASDRVFDDDLLDTMPG